MTQFRATQISPRRARAARIDMEPRRGCTKAAVLLVRPVGALEVLFLFQVRMMPVSIFKLNLELTLNPKLYKP